jgi:thiol-disulfide isomerase/thioredoxin
MRRLLLIALLLLLPLGNVQAQPAFPATKIHQQLASQKGWLNTSQALTAEDMRGRILLLDFWTYCCINCIHIMPDLAYLEQKFGDKLTVIGVHSAKFKNEQDSENIRQAILRYDLHHPVVNDFDFSLWEKFEVGAWPTLILVNPEGKVEKTYAGEGHRDVLEKEIQRLVEKYEGKLVAGGLPLALEKEKAPKTVLKFPGKIIHVPDFEGRESLLVADSAHHRIVAMTMDGRIVAQIGTGVAGRDDGYFDSAQFNNPQGLLFHNNMLYVADTGNHSLRVVDMMAKLVQTVAGTGKQGYEREVQEQPAIRTPLASPWDLALYPDSQHITIAMAGLHQLWKYNIYKTSVSVLAGNGKESIDDGQYPANSLSQPSGLSVLGKQLYFVDAETSSLRVLENENIKTLIGSGLFTFGFKDGGKGQALMQHPLGVFASEDGVYIADAYNHSIRRYDANTGQLTTLAGNGQRGTKDGALKDASFNEPNAVVKVGGKLYVADTNNHAIRVIDLAAGTVSTLQVRQEGTMVDVFSEALPNLVRLPAATVKQGQPLQVILGLQQGWKINKDAPSALTLFEMQAQPKLFASIGLEDLKKGKVMLPALSSGKQYRLQAMLYYCEDKDGAQCLLKSFDLPLSTGDSEITSITLPVN